MPSKQQSGGRSNRKTVAVSVKVIVPYTPSLALKTVITQDCVCDDFARCAVTQEYHRQKADNKTTPPAVPALPALKHCQVCQAYKHDLKEYAGQMVCAADRQRLEGKRLAKAQISFFDDQQPLFQM